MPNGWVNRKIGFVMLKNIFFQYGKFHGTSDSTPNEGLCNKCHKVHYDLTGIIHWLTQFSSQFGNKEKQNVACYRASHKILTNSGLGEGSAPIAGAIQIALEIDSHTKLDFLIANLPTAINYIDNELKTGHPILVGVNHDLNYHGEHNNDHTTDHFVVIVGRNCDNGLQYYRFYEVGTSHEDKGTSIENKLFIYPNRIEGKTAYNTNKKYQVAQVRKNH